MQGYTGIRGRSGRVGFRSGFCLPFFEQAFVDVFDTFEQFLDGAGFEQIVAGPGAHGVERDVGVGVSAQDDDRSIVAPAPHGAQHIPSVHVAQLDVEQDDICRVAGEMFEGVAATPGLIDVESAVAQAPYQGVAEAVLVVDKQYAAVGEKFAFHRFLP